LRRGALGRIRRELREALTAPARALLAAGVLVPLGLFALVALVSEVEPNWSALYLACAVPAAAVIMRPIGRWALAAAAANLLLVSLYGLHAATGMLPLPNAAERIMRETHGYEALADYAAGLAGPVFADRYPFAAMLNFHRPDLGVAQWPGIARPSEYGRGHIAPIPTLDSLRASGFWLLAHKFSAPRIPGFADVETLSVFDCKGQPLQVVPGRASWAAAHCDKPLHGWRLYHYQAAAGDDAGGETASPAGAEGS
jgi:hypothetical protein